MLKAMILLVLVLLLAGCTTAVPASTPRPTESPTAVREAWIKLTVTMLKSGSLEGPDYSTTAQRLCSHLATLREKGLWEHGAAEQKWLDEYMSMPNATKQITYSVVYTECPQYLGWTMEPEWH